MATDLTARLDEETKKAQQPSITSGVSMGASGPRLSDMSLPKSTIDAGINTMRSQVASAASPKVDYGDNSLSGLKTRLSALQQSNGSAPTDPDIAVIGGVRHDVSKPSPVQFNPGAVLGQTASTIASGIGGALSSVGDALTPSRVNALPNREGLDTSTATSAQAKPTAAPAAKPLSAMAASSNGAAVGSPQQPQAQIAAPVAGDIRTLATPGGQKLITNLSDNGAAMAGLKDQAIGSFADGNAVTARSNAIRQSMIDQRDAANGINSPGAVVEDSRVAESNARLDAARAGLQQQQMISSLSSMSPNRRGAAMANIYGAGLQADTARRGQDVNFDISMSGQGVAARGQELSANTARRGQDIAQQTAIAQLGGNPIDQEIKKIGLSQQQNLYGLQNQLAKETDPAKAKALSAQIAALSGKVLPEHNSFKVAEYETADPMGNKTKMPVIIGPDGKERFITPQGGQANNIPAADKRVVGQVYDTPKGKMIWRGNGWEPQA